MDQNIQAEIDVLRQQSQATNLPPDLKAKVDQMISRLQRSTDSNSYFEEYERINHYLNWIMALPWDKRSEDNLDLANAKTVLDTHHYGLEDVKERLLEYLAVLKLNRDQGKIDHIARAPILLLVGLVGTGKTTFAYSLAEAMNREVVRIPFGGMGSARDLRGQSRLHLESEPGYIIKALARCKTKNPVMLLDEIDRVSEDARGDIMGVLVEALDPEQNHSFIDHYIDYPFDLSEVLFIGTANGTSHIATAVMDRMEPMSMPSYTDDEKIQIGKAYLLPNILKESGLPTNVITIDETVWPQIVRPLGYDAGIRTLQRTIKGIVRKVAREYVDGKVSSLHLTDQNIKAYLPSFKTELI
jgi:ATP-dependent Lon protease